MKHDPWRDYAEDTAAIRFWKRECRKREAMGWGGLLAGFILGGIVASVVMAWAS